MSEYSDLPKRGMETLLICSSSLVVGGRMWFDSYTTHFLDDIGLDTRSTNSAGWIPIHATMGFEPLTESKQ